MGYGSSGNYFGIGGDATLSGPARTLRVGDNSGARNSFRVYGGAQAALSTVLIGGGLKPWRNAFIAGGGGVVNASVTLADNHALGAALEAGGEDNPTIVNGSVSIGEGCVVDPKLAADAPPGVYAVLRAASIENWERLALSPEALADGRFSLRVDATSVRVVYSQSATLLLVK